MNQSRAEARVDDGRRGGVAILNPLVQEIIGALLDLGGAAHRDTVVAYVAKRRGVYRASEALADELDTAFFVYCGAGAPSGKPGLLHLPYGPFSRRWALTDQAYGLLRDSTTFGSR